MKLKNLFLASIAVAAMTACSNETEFIDNGNQTVTKDASMQFGIALPKGTLSRAGNNTTGGQGDKETGIPTENLFTDITLVIDNTATQARDIFILGRDEFDVDSSSDQILYLKDGLTVASGNATISAFVNASNALKEDLKSKKTPLKDLKVTKNYSSNIDDLTKAGGIAEAEKFLMSGSVTGQNIKPGEVNTVTVPVNRVAAKLVEKSKKEAFKIDQPTVSTENKLPLTITLENYNFANLLQDTYTLNNTSTIESGLFNKYNEKSDTKWDSYGDSKKITGATKPDDTSNITYCTENKTGNATLVLYKAVAKWGDKAASTFYVDGDKTVYLTFADFSKKYQFEGLTEKSSIADFEKHGIKKYEDGVCYYKSNKIGTILRNNVYYLNVTSIGDLGNPTPGETPNPSTINLTVAVEPWTINIRNIEL